MAMNMDYDISSFLSAYKCPVSNTDFVSIRNSERAAIHQHSDSMDILKKAQQYFTAKLLFLGCNSVLKCLPSLAFLNHHFYVQLLIFVCFLMNFFFINSFTNRSHSPSSFLQTKQFSCCQPHAPCSVERGFTAFHKPGRMWGGIYHLIERHPSMTNIQRAFTIILELLPIF